MKRDSSYTPREAATPVTLAALLAEREKLDKVIGNALAREYPVGALVYWRHGRNWQTGRVIEHWGAMLRARNTNTGNYKDLTAACVAYGDKEYHDGK